MIRFFFFFMLCFLVSDRLCSQRLDIMTQKEIKLADSTKLVFYPSTNKRVKGTGFYFLPVNLKVSKRGTISEFSLMTYDMDKDGVVDGGIMHLLLNWGLTKEQRAEALTILRTTVDSTAIILGSVNISPLVKKQFDITPTELGDFLKGKMNSGSQRHRTMAIPLTQRTKLAISFHFNGEEIDRLNSWLKDEEMMKSTFITFGFSFYGEPIFIKKSLFELIYSLL